VRAVTLTSCCVPGGWPSGWGRRPSRSGPRRRRKGDGGGRLPSGYNAGNVPATTDPSRRAAMDERNDHGQGHGNGQPPDRLNGDRGDGRSPLGRFVKGCKPGPGNPFNRKLGLLRAALVNGLSERNMKQVAQKLLAMTLEGDLQACQMLLAYAHGP